MCFSGHQMSVIWGWGPQVNKFEEVFSDGYQVSLAGDPMSDVQREPGPGGPVSDVHGGQGQNDRQT